MLDEAVQLAGDLLRLVVQLAEPGLREIFLILGDVELAADFPGRGFGLAEVVDKLAPRSAFEAFGDVGHNAHSRTLDLVAEAEVLRKGTSICVLIDRIGQRPRCLPDSQVFEGLSHRFLRCTLDYALHVQRGTISLHVSRGTFHV